MKIGIVTFFQDDNVGTCLQAFALQKKMLELGHHVEILNYIHQDIVKQNKSKRNKIKGILKTYGNKNVFYYKRLKVVDSKTRVKFQEFRNKYFLLSEEKCLEYTEMLKYEDKYDAFVCGSDMIWTPSFQIDHKVYFLQFCNAKKRIAYAPSFGTDSIPANLEKDFGKYIKSFSYLSCREDSGIDLIYRMVGRHAELVLDPTQLIKKEEWEKYFIKEKHEKKYVLCYLFGASKKVTRWYKSLICEIANHYKADIRYMPMNRSEQVHELHYGDASYGPIDFLNLIYNAEFVITNSYHGFMFSLIFEKPFIVVRRDEGLYWSQFEKRFESVLKLIHLENRLLQKGNCVEEKLYDIDYRMINKKLEEQRKHSEKYLYNAIKNVKNSNVDK